jgi:tripartite-type tricarboxylate transporter receptor subunit TctC
VFFDLFRHTAAIEMVHVPYIGGPAVMNALLAGDAGAAVDSVSQALPHIASGRLKALAVTGAERLAALPDVPTFAESGIAGMDDSWTAILAPAGTPGDTLARLHRDCPRALEAPTLLARYAAIGIHAVASSPDELARRFAEDNLKWQRIVNRAGITPE